MKIVNRRLWSNSRVIMGKMREEIEESRQAIPWSSTRDEVEGKDHPKRYAHAIGRKRERRRMDAIERARMDSHGKREREICVLC